MIRIVSPVEARLSDMPWKQVEAFLTYVDKKVDFEVKRFRNSPWELKKIIKTHGEDEGKRIFHEIILNLQKERKKILLFQDDGGYWTYSGLAHLLAKRFGAEIVNEVEYPTAKSLPWRQHSKSLRPYQEEIVTTLMNSRHAGVEVGTGLGKSLCALHLARNYGLKTVVMTPTRSICHQMYTEFKKHLGGSVVGQFGDGKHEYNKLITVAIAASLARIDDFDEAGKVLGQTRVFIADESHLCPAKTLAKICLGLMRDAPYRFFLSGTQLRTDGLDLLLDGITGPIAYTMTVADGVNSGYLAKPEFRVFTLQSSDNWQHRDVNKMTQAHLYYNPRVCQAAAEVANQMVENLNRQVFILIDEIEQFTYLYPHLRHQTKFAYGSEDKQTRAKLPKGFERVDPQILVSEFNDRKFPILVGTSCVGIGTDIRTVGAIIYLQGGCSEIQIRQAIGRGTRLVEGKKDFFFVDFDVDDVEPIHRHAEIRKTIYANTYPSLEVYPW